MLDWLAEVCSGSIPHFTDDESTDLGRGISLSTSLYPSITVGVGYNLVRNIGDIFLNFCVLEFTTDQTRVIEKRGSAGGHESPGRIEVGAQAEYSPLGSKNGVLSVDDSLSPSGLTNKTFTL